MTMSGISAASVVLATFLSRPLLAYPSAASQAQDGERRLLEADQTLAAIKFQKQGSTTRIEGTTDVRGPDEDIWETGYIIGRPVKASIKGMAVSTWEGIVMVGQFAGDQNFATGSAMEVSFEDSRAALADRFNHLDKNKNYVFRYHAPHPMNPTWTDTHYRVTDIIDAKTPEDLPKDFPQEVHTDRVRHGNYSSGDIQGRIISTERWGYWGKVCAFELTTGGIGARSIHAVGYAVYSEEECAFVETLMRYQVPVAVTYSQDTIEIWDSYDHIAHTVKVLAAAQPAGAPAGTQDDYEKFKDRLLQDKDFLQKLKGRLDK